MHLSYVPPYVGAQDERPPRRGRIGAVGGSGGGRLASSGGSGQSAPAAEDYAGEAAAERGFESNNLEVGSALVTPKYTVDLTVNLPVGTGGLTDAPPSGLDFYGAPIKVGKGTGRGRPSHTDVVVSEGRDNVIHAPSRLPRSGTLEFSNVNAGGVGGTRSGWRSSPQGSAKLRSRSTSARPASRRTRPRTRSSASRSPADSAHSRHDSRST
jgi:hypothetical protein